MGQNLFANGVFGLALLRRFYSNSKLSGADCVDAQSIDLQQPGGAAIAEKVYCGPQDAETPSGCKCGPVRRGTMRVALIAHARTGTTMLRSILNNHPNVYFYGEVLYPDYFSWGFFSHIESRLPQERAARLPTNWHLHLDDCLGQLAGLMEDAGKSVVGYDLKLPQLQMIPDSHGALLRSGLAVLHLQRRNTLATVISHEATRLRVAAGGAAHGTVPAEPIVLTLDLEWLRLRVAELEVQDAWVKHAFRHGRYLEIFHEDCITPDGWISTCARLSTFFEIDLDLPFAPTIVKQNSPNLADMLENVDEIRREFSRFF